MSRFVFAALIAGAGLACSAEPAEAGHQRVYVYSPPAYYIAQPIVVRDPAFLVPAPIMMYAPAYPPRRVVAPVYQAPVYRAPGYYQPYYLKRTLFGHYRLKPIREVEIKYKRTRYGYRVEYDFDD